MQVIVPVKRIVSLNVIALAVAAAAEAGAPLMDPQVTVSTVVGEVDAAEAAGTGWADRLSGPCEKFEFQYEYSSQGHTEMLPARAVIKGRMSSPYGEWYEDGVEDGDGELPPPASLSFKPLPSEAIVLRNSKSSLKSVKCVGEYAGPVAATIDVTAPTTDSAGAAWDVFGGAPDIKICVALALTDSEVASGLKATPECSSATQDTFSTFWRTNLDHKRSYWVALFDEDISENTKMVKYLCPPPGDPKVHATVACQYDSGAVGATVSIVTGPSGD